MCSCYRAYFNWDAYPLGNTSTGREVIIPSSQTSRFPCLAYSPETCKDQFTDNPRTSLRYELKGAKPCGVSFPVQSSQLPRISLAANWEGPRIDHYAERCRICIGDAAPPMCHWARGVPFKGSSRRIAIKSDTIAFTLGERVDRSQSASKTDG